MYDFVDDMGIFKLYLSSLFLSFFLSLVALGHCYDFESETLQPSRLVIDGNSQSARKIPDTLFGIFFEVCEISNKLYSSINYQDIQPKMLDCVWTFPS